MSSEREQAQADGYVECSECGHPIERHTGDGCAVCVDAGQPCPAVWSTGDVQTYRRSLGLPGKWEPLEL